MTSAPNSLSFFAFLQAPNAAGNQLLSSDAIYAARGILISLVVLGHVQSSWTDFIEFKKVLYNFHVYGFLMIAMLHPAKPLSWLNFRKIVRRYLTPVLLVSFLAFLLFNLMVRGVGVSRLFSEFPIYVLALVTGNYRHFDSSTGLELFWFMYALAGLVVIRMLMQRYLISGFSQVALLLLCTAIGSLSASVFARDVPAYLGIGPYVLPFGVLAFGIVFLVKRCHRWKPASLAVAVAGFSAMSWFWVPTHSYNLAHLRVPVPPDLLNYMAHVIYVGLAFVLIIFISETRAAQTIFARAGKLSLGIYLCHMFFLYPLSSYIDFTVAGEVARITVIFFLVMIFSFFTSKLIMDI